MREILFRGKIPEDCRYENLRGLWAEGSLVHQTEYYGDPVDRYHILYTGEFDCDYYDNVIVDPRTVGQFTGLLDKNGKKIFEGDILSVNGCKSLVIVEFPDLKNTGEYETLSWNCIVPELPHYRHRLENNPSKYEVVGNIHDNPKLV